MRKIEITYNARTQTYSGMATKKRGNCETSEMILLFHLNELDRVIKALQSVRGKYFDYIPENQVVFEEKQ